MKRTVPAIVLLILAILLTAAACASPKNNDTVKNTPFAPRTSPTPEPNEIYTPVETPEHYFTHIKEGERQSVDDVYCNTDENGRFKLSVSYTDGTPYSFDSILFDPNMLSGQHVTLTQNGSDAAGSGSTNMKWLFIPIAAGETDILLLTNNLSEGIIEGRLFHIIINETLTAALAYYEDGIIGVNYTLVDSAKATATDK